MTKFYMRYYGNNVYLMRLNNMGEYKSTYFSADLPRIAETTMTGNQLKSTFEENRYRWKQQSGTKVVNVEAVVN